MDSKAFGTRNQPYWVRAKTAQKEPWNKRKITVAVLQCAVAAGEREV